MAETVEENLKDAQEKMKTIFPKVNQRDRIQQELDAMKVCLSYLFQWFVLDICLFHRRVKVSMRIRIVYQRKSLNHS